MIFESESGEGGTAMILPSGCPCSVGFIAGICRTKCQSPGYSPGGRLRGESFCIFQSCWDELSLPGYYQYFRGVKCLAQGHNTALVTNGYK